MRIAFTHNLQLDHDDESQAEFDRQETVDAIATALEQLGHQVTPVDVGRGSVSSITARLEAVRPDLVFNTAEGSRGRFREAFWPGMFDALGLPFTGSDAWVCAVTLDKQLTKLLVNKAGVPTPRWVFVNDAAHIDACADLRFPLIAKPNAEGSSKGITVNSIVEDEPALRALLRTLLPKYPAGILVEEFIVGKDVVVPWLQAASPATGGVLSPCSYRFDESIIGKRRYTIYDYELKCVKSEAVEVQVPADVDDVVTQRLLHLSRVVYDTLGMHDLGRIDWRVDDNNDVTFIEVNALPSLEPGAGIYLAAALAGLRDTTDVLGAVIESASRRYGLVDTAPVRGSGLRVGFTHNVKRIAAKSAADDDSHAEYDAPATIDLIAKAIESHGHTVVRLEANASIVQALPLANVDVVFNLAEGERGRGREAHVPALLELLDIPFTGSDAATMAIALDKELAKRVVGGAGVPVPRGLLLTGDEPSSTFAHLQFPLIGKPNAEGSSKGVLPECVVENEAALRALVKKLYAKYQQPILVEEFLPGREFTVGILADEHDFSKPALLPPMEIVYLDKSKPLSIYAFEDKLDWSKTIRYDRPAVVDDALLARINEVALGAWKALGCRDVGRVDLRCDASGQPRFIEANPLPGLTPGWSDLCLVAESAGLTYEALIGRVLAPALDRLRVKRNRTTP